jgi:hypothetical protein
MNDKIDTWLKEMIFKERNNHYSAFFCFNTHQKLFFCCILIVRLIIKYIYIYIYMYNVCLSNNKNCRLLLLFLFSLMLAYLLLFLYLLIEVAVNKYWTNAFSLILSFIHIYSLSCVHTAICFLKTMYTRITLSRFFFFYFILKYMRMRERERI